MRKIQKKTRFPSELNYVDRIRHSGGWPDRSSTGCFAKSQTSCSSRWSCCVCSLLAGQDPRMTLQSALRDKSDCKWPP